MTGEVEVVKKGFDAKESMPAERWGSLIEDCRDIIVEHVVRSREAVIEMKWYLGDRLLEEGEEAVKPVLKKISAELKVGERDLYYCVAFRKRFSRIEDVWGSVPEGKNISWHKLVHKYIDFTMPRPELPIGEMADEFGIIDWWKAQEGLTALRLKGKDSPFCLVVKMEKDGKLPAQTGAREIYKELGEYFIKIKRWDPQDLDHGDYARMNKALKLLLDKAKGDKERVKQAIKWCDNAFSQKGLDWTLETVNKRFAEAVRPVKPHEKYLKKGGRR